MICDYDIGDHVVCVDGDFHMMMRHYLWHVPVEGQTYVVRDIRLGINLKMKGDVSVLLVGLVNPCSESEAGLERGFRSDRFRKLEDLKKESVEDKSKPNPEWVAVPEQPLKVVEFS